MPAAVSVQSFPSRGASAARRAGYSLFDGTYYSDNRSNSRANTCNKPRLLEGMHLLDKRSTQALPVALMIHDNSRIARPLCRRRIIQISALSTFDVGPWVGPIGPPSVCTSRLVPSASDALLALTGRVVSLALLL
ncbi:hypothetical protein S245_024069 [Arachis hypogaea]